MTIPEKTAFPDSLIVQPAPALETTSQIVGIGTTSTDDADLQGIGNSARGMYVSNGMIIMDNLVSGNHYIGTNFNGLMVGPVNIEGTISIDGNYVVV